MNAQVVMMYILTAGWDFARSIAWIWMVLGCEVHFRSFESCGTVYLDRGVSSSLSIYTNTQYTQSVPVLFPIEPSFLCCCRVV